MDMYTPLYLKWITDKDLRKAQEALTQRYEAALEGRGTWGKKDPCVCVWIP